MATVSSSSAYDIKIESVTLTAERLGSTSWELAPSIAEINLFENIDLPYLTGSLMLSDTFDLMNKIGFRGTEKISIKAKINGDDTSKVIEQKMIVTDIKIVATSDMGEMILVNLIEDYAYANKLITVSKAYSGKPEEIIAKIFKDTLNMEVNVPDEFTSSPILPMKVIIPNMTPLDSVRWIKDRLVTENGFPFFLYSTINSDKPFLIDLEYMLQQAPRNSDRPYAYGQSFNRWSSANNVFEQARNIESYNLPKAENMIKLAEQGALHSAYQFVDTVNGKFVGDDIIKFNIQEVMDKMVDLGILDETQRAPIYDDQFTFNDKTFEDYTPSAISQITSSNTYADYINYYEANDIAQQKNKVISRAIRYYLLKSPLEIVMPGFDFLGRGENTTIGRQIMLQFLKNDPNILSDNVDQPLDTKRSGRYLIYAARHIIRPERYAVAMSCVKLADKK